MFLVIFPIFSICNLHDISWGTKGLNEAAEIARNDVIESEITVNEQVRAKLRRITKLHAKEKAERAIQHDRSVVQCITVRTMGFLLRFGRFRSYVLLSWMLSQGLYISLITTIDDNVAGHVVGVIYLKAMFLVIAAWGIIRFVGSTFYLLAHVITRKKKVPAYPSIPHAQV